MNQKKLNVILGLFHGSYVLKYNKHIHTSIQLNPHCQIDVLCLL